MIIPRVKNQKYYDGKVILDEAFKIYFSDKESEKLDFVLSEFFQDIKATKVSLKDDANIIISKDEKIKKRELYTIEAKTGKIYITYGDFLGGRNAISTLAQLICKENNTIFVKETFIEDFPDASFRSFMHDCGRKYIPLDLMKMHILLMAKCKMNVMHFHLSEADGFSIALKKYPNLHGASVTDGKQYTEEEIILLVDYAERLGIEIIPEIDVPGHGVSLTKAFPKISCVPEDGEKSWGWALCVGNEDTYSVLEGIISETLKLFKSKYFHLGTDEISMTDEKRLPHPVADWTRCKRCKALLKERGYKNEVELFYHFLRKMHKTVSALGKKLIIWNDWVDISVTPDIPKDIVIEFWRVAAETRGPHIGCSMQRFLEEGFDVINASYPDTYIDLYVSYPRLKKWCYNKIPACDEVTEGKIIGADLCAWDVHPHYEHSLPVAIPIFAEKLWNSETEWQNELLPEISRLLLGANSFNIFDYTLEVINLDDGNKIFRDDVDLNGLRTKLISLTPKDTVQKYCIDTYLSLCK